MNRRRGNRHRIVIVSGGIVMMVCLVLRARRHLRPRLPPPAPFR